MDQKRLTHLRQLEAESIHIIRVPALQLDRAGYLAVHLP